MKVTQIYLGDFFWACPQPHFPCRAALSAISPARWRAPGDAAAIAHAASKFKKNWDDKSVTSFVARKLLQENKEISRAIFPLHTFNNKF